MVTAQVYEGTWEELAQHRDDYGDHRLMLMVLPNDAQHPAESEAQQKPAPRPRFGSGKGIFHMAPDFDAPLEDFKEYME